MKTATTVTMATVATTVEEGKRKGKICLKITIQCKSKKSRLSLLAFDSFFLLN